MNRKLLQSRRKNITQHARVGGITGQSLYYTFGMYEDGTLGEVFVDIAKAGSALRNWASEAAMLLSVAIQHGMPLETSIKLFLGNRCEPCGEVLGHVQIRYCTSIMDLICRDIGITFLGMYYLADKEDTTASTTSRKEDTNGRGETMDATRRSTSPSVDEGGGEVFRNGEATGQDS